MSPRSGRPARVPTLFPGPGLTLVATVAAWITIGMATANLALADGPADNLPDKVRPVPPPGIPIPADVREELRSGADFVAAQVRAFRSDSSTRTNLIRFLPDIEVFAKAVDWALRYNEFYRTNEIEVARLQLKEALSRLEALRTGTMPWLEKRGPVAGGYLSKIDGSIQPFGVVVPESYQPASGRKLRLDFWFHGRGEQLTELAFLNDRSRNRGEFAPPDTLVLHLYGRYCNGSRFAGETDFWEALDEVRRRYPIDEDRLVVRGFSLGGAACWHMALHHAWRWAAAAPGAGFSETAEFLRVFQGEELQTPWWEQKLWRLYDSTAIAANVAMVPLVVYSGENDRQIQAARAMEQAALAEGLVLTHLIGPRTGHSYEPTTKVELNRRIDALADLGRERLPRSVRFVTHTLRYPRMAWVTLDGLRQHWEPARIEASLDAAAGRIRLVSSNVDALTLELETGLSPFDPRRPVDVELDGQLIPTSRPGSDRSWRASFHRAGRAWQPGTLPSSTPRKRPGLQGPIDDAFLEPFLFVVPEPGGTNSPAGRWAEAELRHAIDQWRRQFRGDAPLKRAAEVTDADVTGRHLILWGDPASNPWIAKVADRLAVRWSDGRLKLGDRSVDAGTHVPILIQPNPLNPARYVVLNSGFTYREYDYLNNARQTPKLPDWALVDVRQPANSRYPGHIVDAGFFDEAWQFTQ